MWQTLVTFFQTAPLGLSLSLIIPYTLVSLAEILLMTVSAYMYGSEDSALDKQDTFALIPGCFFVVNFIVGAISIGFGDMLTQWLTSTEPFSMFSYQTLWIFGLPAAPIILGYLGMATRPLISLVEYFGKQISKSAGLAKRMYEKVAQTRTGTIVRHFFWKQAQKLRPLDRLSSLKVVVLNYENNFFDRLDNLSRNLDQADLEIKKLKRKKAELNADLENLKASATTGFLTTEIADLEEMINLLDKSIMFAAGKHVDLEELQKKVREEYEHLRQQLPAMQKKVNFAKKYKKDKADIARSIKEIEDLFSASCRQFIKIFNEQDDLQRRLLASKPQGFDNFLSDLNLLNTKITASHERVRFLEK